MKNTIWQQWDKQTNDRLLSYIDLNNLYLDIQAGRKRLSITTSNTLRVLVSQAYDPKPGNDFIREWWSREFEKLKGWFNF